MSTQTQHEMRETRKVVLLMGMSIDGYGAGGWTPPVTWGADIEDMHDEVRRQLASIDTFLFGRVSFELWEKFWPAMADDPRSAAFEKEFSRLTDAVQKVVYSKTLKSAAWQNSRLVNGSIADDVARMKRTSGRDLAIVGGPRLARAFGELGLIDEYRLWIHPTIAGSGTPLLGNEGTARDLDVVDVKAFGTGGLSVHLRPKER
jgi:dihydrofolate reductase